MPIDAASLGNMFLLQRQCSEQLRAIVVRLVEHDPHLGDGLTVDDNCFYCAVARGSAHAPDCLWANARDVLNGE